ncbi:MAG: zeta toxin family protein [Defluviitaleaceae bacterium]|nr:zeta toxin family protein [Defluviitaleaceae bacterium]
MNDKVLTVFAGANGSGKSTIVRNVLSADACPEYFICPDNLVDPVHKDDVTAYVHAMNKAEQLRETALINGVSFSFETVLSTYEKVDFMKRAKRKGYILHVHYVLTKGVEINIKRVETRVSQGGHDVPRDKIISRYEKAMNLMPEVLALADIAMIYDNTEDYPQILMFCGKGDKLEIQSEDTAFDGVKNVIITQSSLPAWFVQKYYNKIFKAFQ